MGKSARYVFSASSDVHQQITDLFDFIHPTTIALWNLSWQVKGFVECHPGVSQADIDARFARGLNVNSGSIKNVCIDKSWDDQLENFALIILVNCISAFEDFCAQISRIIKCDEDEARKLEVKFQFPPNEKNVFNDVGVKSSVIANSVNWDKAVISRYHPDHIEGLLICYRYFKEFRNAYSHNGRRASQRTVDAHQRFHSVVTQGGMGTLNVPSYEALCSVGDKVKLHYRGVIGLTQVIMSIITYYDVELSNYSIAEDEIKRRLKPDSKKTWPTDGPSIEQRISSLFTSAGFPRVTNSESLKAFLRANGVIPSYVP